MLFAFLYVSISHLIFECSQQWASIRFQRVASVFVRVVRVACCDLFTSKCNNGLLLPRVLEFMGELFFLHATIRRFRPLVLYLLLFQ